MHRDMDETIQGWPYEPQPGEVLALLGTGMSNAELSRELGVGAPTVKSHVSRVLSKLHLTSRVQAAILARELEL